MRIVAYRSCTNQGNQSSLKPQRPRPALGARGPEVLLWDVMPLVSGSSGIRTEVWHGLFGGQHSPTA